MTGAPPATAHATAVLLKAGCVLLTGSSGSGKSDLALRLIDRGALLVADDRCLLHEKDGRLMVRPPPTLAGLLEVRGLGILRLPYAAEAQVLLNLDLDEVPDRLPSPGSRMLAGVNVPRLPFDSRSPSAAIRAEWAVALAARLAL